MFPQTPFCWGVFGIPDPWGGGGSATKLFYSYCSIHHKLGPVIYYLQYIVGLHIKERLKVTYQGSRNEPEGLSLSDAADDRNTE